MTQTIVSAYNGVKLDVAGPHEAAFYRSAHDGKAFDKSASRTFGGANIVDGKVVNDIDQTPPSSELDMARERAAARERASAESAAQMAKVPAGGEDDTVGGEDNAAGVVHVKSPEFTSEQVDGDAKKLANKLNLPVRPKSRAAPQVSA